MKLKKHAGFTLIELLVVVAIISLLSSIVMASLNSARVKARDAKRLTELRELAKAFELYYDDNGFYPPNPPLAGNYSWSSWNNWSSIIPASYISKVPVDPINNDLGACHVQQGCYLYHYCVTNGGQGFVLVGNLENPLKNPMGDYPGCEHGGPNHFWIQAGN